MSAVDMTKRLFSVEDAANYLSISKRLMWTLIKDGQVAKTPIGSRTLVDRVDLDAYIDRIKAAS